MMAHWVQGFRRWRLAWLVVGLVGVGYLALAVYGIRLKMAAYAANAAPHIGGLDCLRWGKRLVHPGAPLVRPRLCKLFTGSRDPEPCALLQ